MLGSLQIHSHNCPSALRAPEGKCCTAWAGFPKGRQTLPAAYLIFPAAPEVKEGPLTAVGHQSFCTRTRSHCVAYAATWRALTRDHLLGEMGGNDPAVGQRREDSGGVSQHAADAQHQQHDEVEHGVQLGHLHVFDRFRIDYKCQSCPLDGLPARRGEEVSYRQLFSLIKDLRTGT